MLKRIHHTAIMVSDMERSIAWYQQVLGMRLTERHNLGGRLIAFVEVAGAQVELVQKEEPFDSKGVVNHVAFEVADIRAVMARLREAGVTLEQEQPIPIWEGGQILFFRGPDNERLELVQPGQ